TGGAISKVTDARDVQSRQPWYDLMRKLVTKPIILDDGCDLGFCKLAHLLRNRALLRIENIEDFVVIAVDRGRRIQLLAGRSRCHGHVILPLARFSLWGRCGRASHDRITVTLRPNQRWAFTIARPVDW